MFLTFHFARTRLILACSYILLYLLHNCIYCIYCILVSRPLACFICIIFVPVFLFECIHYWCCLFMLFSPPVCTSDRHSSTGGGIHWLLCHPSLQTPKPRSKQTHPDAVGLCGPKHFEANSYLSTTVECIYS